MQPGKDQFVMGMRTLEEILLHGPEKLVRIFTSLPKSHALLKRMEAKGIEMVPLSQHQLTKMVQSDSHQSIVGQIKPRKIWELKEFVQVERVSCFLLLLDQIFDPQNFGAIMRSAECFGVDGVIWSKNRGTDLTPVVSKSSSGASEFISLIRVSNLATSIDLLKKAGFEVIASILNPKSESAYGFSYSPLTVLILGSEGEGIQPLLRQKADRSIYLPMKGKIQSLNVAQSAAAFLALRPLQAQGGLTMT